jgi:hypothetical protein
VQNGTSQADLINSFVVDHAGGKHFRKRRLSRRSAGRTCGRITTTRKWTRTTSNLAAVLSIVAVDCRLALATGRPEAIPAEEPSWQRL